MDIKFDETKDYCTCWFESMYGVPIKECCHLHDRRYANKRIMKHQADLLLFRCVRRKANVLVASTMYLGVTLFGDEYYKEAQRENM